MKVRIAVAIDPYGGWCACGGSRLSSDEQLPDGEMADSARDGVREGERIYFLEADLDPPPPPKEPENPVTVTAEVVKELN